MPRATLLALVLVAPAHVTGVTYLSGAESGGLGTALFGGGSSSDDCTTGFLDAVFSAADPSLEADTLSVARCGLTAASLPEDDILIFAGGHDSSGYLDTVDVYRATKRDTSDSAAALALTGKRAYPVGAADSTTHTIFITGGFEQQRFTYIKSDGVDMFRAAGEDGAVVQYSAPPMPLGGICFHGAAATEGTLWVGGGTGDYGMSNVVQVLDVGADADAAAWRSADVTPRLSSNRTRLAAASLSTDDCPAVSSSPVVCFAGGEGDGDNEEDDEGSRWACSGSLCMSTAVDCFDAVTGEAVETGLKLTEARSRLVGVAVGCTIVFAGGKTLDGYSSRVDAFDFSVKDPASGPYSYTSELSAERADLAAARSGSSEAMFVGGMDDSGVVDVVDTWSPSEFRATGGSAESAVF